MSELPDLRCVCWVALKARPPRRQLLGRVVRGLVFATVGASMFAEGDAVIPMLIGGVLGGLGGSMSAGHPFSPSAGVALVPWGLLVERASDTSAIRWSGVQTLHVAYHKAYDGSVYARVEIDSIAGRFVGFAPDTIDLGALGNHLDRVVAASARPLALDLEGGVAVEDGAQFAERTLSAARRLVSTLGEALGLAPASYRGAQMAAKHEEPVIAALRAQAERVSEREEEPWALLAAVAGELRLHRFAPELHRLAAAPHPAVAAVARAAVQRLAREPADDADEETLGWFVDANDLATLRAWSRA
ncbi:MAG: hypothetical protein IPJ34_30835 [Myxococcales bacterium]|nr:hypothetical protein [Myxococcales bacterium]